MQGDDRYAESSIPALEKAVRASYTLENALALLKVYQLHPHAVNKDTAAFVLLSAQAEGNFHVLSYMLTPQLRSDEKIGKLFAISEAYETAHYKKFWDLLKDCEYASQVPTLSERCRQSILDVIGLTYQRIDSALLIEMLNVNGADELQKLLAAKKGWRVEGNVAIAPLQARNQSVPASRMTSVTQEQKIQVLKSMQ